MFRAAAARAAAARILYLLSYGSTAKACLLLLLGSLLSACQSVLCQLQFADSLRILSFLSSNSIAKACFYLLPGSLVPILASSGFDGRFAAPQEGPETSQKPVRNQGRLTFPNLPPIQMFFSSLSTFGLFSFSSEERDLFLYIYIYI